MNNSGALGWNPLAVALAVAGQVLLFAALFAMAPEAALPPERPAPAVRTVLVTPELVGWGPGQDAAPMAAAVEPAGGSSAEPTASAPQNAAAQPTAVAAVPSTATQVRPRATEVAPASGGPVAPPVSPAAGSSSGSSTAPEPARVATTTVVEKPEAAPVVRAETVVAPPVVEPAPLVSTPEPARPPRSEETHPARVVGRVLPTMPPIARAQRVSGIVVVKVTLDAKGVPESTEVIQSPSPLLNQAALDAARKMKYEPALVNGQPVRANIDVSFNFALR